MFGSIRISLGQLHPSHSTGPTEDEEDEEEWWATNDVESSDDDDELEDVLTETLLDDETIEEELDEDADATNVSSTIWVPLIGSWSSTVLLVTSLVWDSNVRSRSTLTMSEPTLDINCRFLDSSPSCSGVAGSRVLSYSVLQDRSRSEMVE